MEIMYVQINSKDLFKIQRHKCGRIFLNLQKLRYFLFYLI